MSIIERQEAEAILRTDKKASEGLFSINDVAVQLGVHQQTLRNWERKKLVVPLRIGARRVYTDAHLQKCHLIKKFSGKGISLKGIKELMDNIKEDIDV